MKFDNITHAEWSLAFETGMRSAGTFRAQSNLVFMGAVALFWRNSKNISYLNSAIQYAEAYRGIRVEAVKKFLVHFTGAKYDGKFVKAGKLKACREGFDELESWLDFADREAPEVKFDAIKLVQADEKAVLRLLEKKLDAARDALTKVRSADSVDTVAETLILNHIAHTESLKAMAASVYN